MYLSCAGITMTPQDLGEKVIALKVPRVCGMSRISIPSNPQPCEVAALVGFKRTSMKRVRKGWSSYECLASKGTSEAFRYCQMPCRLIRGFPGSSVTRGRAIRPGAVAGSAA